MDGRDFSFLDFMDKLPADRLRAACRRAIAAGVAHMGATYPNPAVGCAIVDAQGKILAVGAHERAGAEHAEINALKSLEASGRARDAYALIATLEPCAHYGRTAPCALALAHFPIKNILIGASDPSARARGGAAILRTAGRRVAFAADFPQVEDFARDGACLVSPFMSRQLAKKPWILVKQAVDAAGSMTPPPGRSTFTSRVALRTAHILRRAADTIITTTATVEADAPRLDVRHVDDFPHARRHIIVMGESRIDPAWIAGRERSGASVRCVRDFAELRGVCMERGTQLALVEAGSRFLQSLQPRAQWAEWLCISKEADGHERAQSLMSEGGVSFQEDFLDAPARSVASLLAEYAPDWPNGWPVESVPEFERGGLRGARHLDKGEG